MSPFFSPAFDVQIISHIYENINIIYLICIKAQFKESSGVYKSHKIYIKWFSAFWFDRIRQSST
jgi:hypothetical protein